MSMIEHLARRLAQLKEERPAYEEKLRQLDAERVEVSNTLQRINGAIQVLEEEIEEQKRRSDEAGEE